MNRLGALAVTAMVLATSALPAEAQERRRERRGAGDPSITLYELPDYQGRSMTFYFDAPNLADQSFNDRARSARIEGSWRLCGDKNYRSRCEPFGGDVRDLGQYDFSNQISSLQMVGGRPGRPGFEGPPVMPARPAAGRDAVEGRSVVFFRRPSVNGVDVAAMGPGSADAFCRRVGLDSAVYAYERDRAREAVDADGAVHRGAPVLRDVLCRRASGT